MIEITFSSTFKKAFEKRIKKNKKLETKFWGSTELFIEDPFHQSLRTHKLSGELKNLWSFSVEFDCRVIFFFKNKKQAIFIDIGTHAEVY